MAIKTIDVKPIMIQCKHCRSMVRSDRMSKHIARVHGNSEVTTINNDKTHQELPTTPIENKSDPIGVKVIKALKLGQNFIAKAACIERCENCQKRIIFLNTGENKTKAFDVSRMNTILCTHACDPDAKSESLYTYSGGIIDSNRRRH